MLSIQTGSGSGWGSRRPAGLVALIAAFGISLLTAAPGQAATITVNTTADENSLDNASCALREAIQSGANNSVAGTGCVAQGAFGPSDTVRLPAGFYRLTLGGPGEDGNEEGDIDVGFERVFLVQTGAGPAIVDGNGNDRVFHVLPGGVLEITGLVIQNGDAGAGSGGGIMNEGVLVVERSTIRGNTANLGGGLIGAAGTTAVQTSTISANRADDTGGGYHQLAGVGNLNNSTVTNNTADADGDGTQGGGGVRVLSFLSLHGSIIAGNIDGDPTPVNAPDCSAPDPGDLQSDSGGNNLIQAPCPGFTPGGADILGVGPKLGALADNGGPTPTHALLKGSPAIGKGGSICPPTDQRFAPRTPSPCDVGAYERLLCARRLVNRVGTNANDRLVGTPKADGMLGFGGRDVLIGRRGADGLCGGAGRDRLVGGWGNDRLLGGPGADLLLGGLGRDLLRGHAGRDRLIGGRGADRLKGGPGRDRQRQ